MILISEILLFICDDNAIDEVTHRLQTTTSPIIQVSVYNITAVTPFNEVNMNQKHKLDLKVDKGEG